MRIDETPWVSCPRCGRPATLITGYFENTLEWKAAIQCTNRISCGYAMRRGLGYGSADKLPTEAVDKLTEDYLLDGKEAEDRNAGAGGSGER